ncbi:MAG TPA: UDP-galactopyranose mutase [Puia sp.]|jgi:UDP-galactopyranose mutase|nr:UDP-galactopyranose mutase [Puia sp.]
MELREYSYIIVGSGFSGAVIAERIASQLHQPVLVIEKRDHIGGNCYSEADAETGIEYHRYGTHIFHTSNERVWNYIRRFTSFNNYRHRVLSCHNGRNYPFPINLETINQFYHLNLKPYEVDDFIATIRDNSIRNPGNFEEQALALLGRDLYEAFFRPYTIKQWQADPRELPAAIFNRIPLRSDYDESYFSDTWQGIPSDGYTAIFENLLADRKIRVLLNTDYFALKDQLDPDACVIYSGPIDRFFDYKYGKLSWRTLRFEKETIDTRDFQGNAVINFPDLDIPYTRIHEPRHLHPERQYETTKTIIFREYSLADKGDEPYYPIPSPENQRLLSLYRQEATRQSNVFITGRLGDYKYYDMHQTIDRALDIFETGILPRTHLTHA